LKAIVLVSPGVFKQEEREKPKPGQNQVLIKVFAVGVCQTDIDIYVGKRNDPGWQPPRVIGHEISGTVYETGPGVTGLKTGQPVVIDPVVTCGCCWFCQHGLLCPNGGLIGGSIDGGLQEFIVVPAENVVPVPETLSLEEAAIIEPLACVLTAYKKVNILHGDTVAVVGPGIGGLCFTQLAKNSGAQKVILIGAKENRLALGKKLGADKIVNIKNQDPVQTVMSETNDIGADVVFEVTGNQESIRNTLSMVRPSGSIVAYGIPLELVNNFDLQKLILKDLTLHSGVGPWQTFVDSVRLVETGKVKMKEMLTHRFGVDDIDRVINMVRNRKDDIIKAIVKW
jgi:2-desacetyl-2-hydroxyethyl bacteriochlorophyllide A dehydrogenase